MSDVAKAMLFIFCNFRAVYRQCFLEGFPDVSYFVLLNLVLLKPNFESSVV
jgi:hypothetical protein